MQPTINANLFYVASRTGLRFHPNSGGSLAVDDLWDLSLQSLDKLAISINARIQPEAVTFLENPDLKTTKERNENTLRLEIVKEVIRIKQEESKVAKANAEIRNQRAFLEDLLRKRNLDDLQNLSAEEIQKRLDDLNAETGAAAPALV